MKPFPYGFVKKTCLAGFSNYNTSMGYWRAYGKVWLIGLVFGLAITLPYLYAWGSAGEGYEFGGFLVNPLDGNSYLAKMYQGWRGDLQFSLPYTAEPGDGAYLYLYYLFLGHLSRALSAPLVVIYHLARLAGAVFMLCALYRFCMAVVREARLGWLAFALAAFGAGLGWLGLPLGIVSADFWVAEAYPFLSAYTNAHFPLVLGILLWILTPPRQQIGVEDNAPFRQVFIHSWVNALLGLALAVVSPFAVAVALVVCLGVIAARRLFRRSGWVSQVYASRLIWVAAGSLPVLVYDLWAFGSSPQLGAWNAQNITPALPAWDVLLSFSPVLLLAFLAGWRFWRERKTLDEQALDAWLVPLAWALTAMILVYLPFNLQRRFIVGLYVPLSVLAVWGLDWLAGGRPRRTWLLAFLMFLLVLPTNLFVLLSARYGLQTHDPLIVIRQDEVRALQWLEGNASPDALVLAAPRTGLFIPAHTGRRVIYGHPYETVQAESEKQAVLDFFSASWSQAQRSEFLEQRRVDYVFYGPEEQALGGLPPMQGLSPVFQSGDVTLFGVLPGSSSSPARLAADLSR